MLNSKQIRQTFLDFFKSKIEEHPVVRYIGEFNHFEHTKSIEGEIAEDIQDCQLIMFCFGKKIPNGRITAARPRSISVTQYTDRFEISFLEAPAEIANETMEGWVKELKNNLNN